MPFDHNDRYHRLLLRQVPAGCRTALDVGCGTGRFARRLARHGIQVDAIDRSAEVIRAARAASPPPAGGGGVRYLLADVTTVELPAGRYDYVSCLASIHHVPFATVASLREALAPGGVLAVLGCYRQSTAADFAVFLVAAPVNAAARVAVAALERARRSGTREPPRAPVTPALMTLGQGGGGGAAAGMRHPAPAAVAVPAGVPPPARPLTPKRRERRVHGDDIREPHTMGSDDDFESFYAAAFHRIAGQLFAVTGDLQDAEDVTQEAFARASVRWSRVRTYDIPEAWVRRVALRLATDRFRQARRRLAALRRVEVEPRMPAVSVEALALAEELRDLPLTWRKAIVLHHLVGMPVEEAARTLGVPAGTVKTWLARGRRVLAARLGEQEGAVHRD